MNRRYLWLLSAVLLLGLVAWLMPTANPALPSKVATAPEVHFPEHPEPVEQQKMAERHTLPAALPAAAAAAAADPASKLNQLHGKRDPLLVALPPRSELIVFEAKTFFKRPVGQMVLACFQSHDMAPSHEIQGVDLKAVDRLAMANLGTDARLIVLSGNLSALDFRKIFDLGQGAKYGDQALINPPATTLAEHPIQNALTGSYVATWKNELALISSSRHELEMAIDRLEGRDASAAAIADSEAYSEMYGRVSAHNIAQLLSGDIADIVAKADMTATFHANAPNDIALVVDAEGAQPAAGETGKALAAAFAAQRVKAASVGNKRLASLLDLYSVTQRAEGFLLKAAFPREFMQEELGACAKPAGAKASKPARPGAAGSAH